MKVSSYIIVAFLALVVSLPLHSQGAMPGRPKNFNSGNTKTIWRQPTKAEDAKINALVILGAFSDVSFTFSNQQFKEVLSLNEFSAERYLEDQLGYKVNIDIFGPYTVSKKRSYYGTNGSDGDDLHPGEFIADVCLAADGEIDFSKYDFDNDGEVDNVFVVYAGGDECYFGELHSDYIWAHSWTLKDGDYKKTLSLDGKTVNQYACHSEIDSFKDRDETIAQIGGFCHEFLHPIGLKDYYDSDYEKSGGTAAGVWKSTSIMDGGGFNNYGSTPPNLNAVSREMLGLLTPAELAPGKYQVYPIGDDAAKTYKITNPNDPKEYYLLECRSNEGWDKYIGGKGMLLYHIDKSEKYSTFSERNSKNITSQQRWSTFNEINCRPDHQCLDLIEADGRVDKDPTTLSLNDIKGVFFPQPGAYEIGGTANVKLPFLDGTYAKILIKNIALDADGVISFDAYSTDSPLPPTPVEPPKNTDNVYIIVQTEDGVCELSVSNSVGATVAWFFNGAPISAPEHFCPTSSGELKAVITWSDGTSDILFKNISK